MKAEVKNNTLFIEIPFNEEGVPSASGKTTVHASTHGNIQTTVTVKGKPLTIGVNAYMSRR